MSWGGTATAAQIGLMDRLHQGDYQLIDRDTGKTPEEKQAPDAPGPDLRHLHHEQQRHLRRRPAGERSTATPTGWPPCATGRKASWSSPG
ncbi:MAG: hypothetical protein ACLR5H_09970 [Oscillospiraceae bacterium]